MAVLGEREQEAVRSVLGSLERDVEVVLDLGPTATPVTLLAAGGRELDSGAITHDVVAAVCAESERVRLTVVEHDEPGPWPRTTIGPGLVYRGMPVGYELTTLVHALAEAGKVAPSLSAPTLERLVELERDVAIDVFVTPT